MIGGYIMIDWQGNTIPFDPEISVTIPGIYENFKNAHSELICVDNSEQIASNIPQILI